MLVGVVRRQVTDVPAVSLTVTEHRLQRRRCECGCVTSAAAPAGVADAPASYGLNVRAWVVYASVFQHIPVARVAELIRDLCGATPSTGWICGVLRQTAVALAEVEKLIRTLLTEAHILHVDETGAKVTGACWWQHVAATSALTSYHLDRSRCRAAIEEFGVLDGLTGIAVHDAWASYNSYADCEHTLCGAHIARELVTAGGTHPDRHWPIQALDPAGAGHTNAMAESFFGTLKNERVHRVVYPTRKAAIADIAAYIELRYDSRHIHSDSTTRPPTRSTTGT
jgi:transposase